MLLRLLKSFFTILVLSEPFSSFNNFEKWKAYIGCLQNELARGYQSTCETLHFLRFIRETHIHQSFVHFKDSLYNFLFNHIA